MKGIGVLLGCVSVVYVATLTIEPCKSEVIGPSNKSNATLPVGPEITNHDVEDDDFVPYRGQQFNTFDWRLLKATSKRNSGNLLLSPISLKIALVLLYEGAQDQTAYEIANALQLPVTAAAIRERFTTILQSLQAHSSACKLNIGTRIYIDSNISTRQRYAATLQMYYNTSVITTSLSDAHSIVNDVNTWVSNVTEGNIDRMIEDESSMKDSLMLIMNAIFFKGSWRRRYFSPENTKIQEFHTSDNRKVNVPFMRTVGRFYYSESAKLDAKILRIPYDGHKFAMYLVLPRSRNGIEQMINDIDPYTLARDAWQVQDLPVDVSIPKFKFEYSNHLEDVLRELGIRDIFDNTATLTGIAKTRRASKHLQVSDIVQKAGIEVNENGTTAFAATEVQLVNKIEDQTFHANHPFMFYIQDEDTGTILYMGKVMNPLNVPEDTTGVKQQFPPKLGAEVQNADSNLQAGINAGDRNNLFNIHFSQILKKEYNGNLISSAAGIKTALMMLMEGAGGSTKNEIMWALRLPENEERLQTIMRSTLMSLKRNENGTEIDLASRLWLDENLRVLDNYKQILQSYYEGDTENVKFSEPEKAARLINDWVLRATRNKLSSPVMNNIQPNTRLMLTSVIYFKGRWLKSFDKTKTKLQCFYTANNECKNTYFMVHNTMYRYANLASIEAEVLEIPYSDGKTVMLTIMPYQKGDPDLRILSNDLITIPLSVILANLKSRDVTLYLPKFTIENSFNLMPTLQSMGIESIFKSNANLTNIVSNGSLQVTSILQNVKIEVDEEGTLAAADTEIGINYLSAFGNDVKLDQPFLFLIVDTVTNTILFCGRFIEPL